MAKTNLNGAEEEPIDRVQMVVRVPRWLHRALKHAAIDKSTTMNDLVLKAIERCSQQHFDAPSGTARSSRATNKKDKQSSGKE